jgi:hypothetical protein
MVESSKIPVPHLRRPCGIKREADGRKGGPLDGGRVFSIEGFGITIRLR